MFPTFVLTPTASPSGPSGAGTPFTGNWSDATEYTVGQTVLWTDSNYYIAIVPSTDVDPTHSGSWLLLQGFLPIVGGTMQGAVHMGGNVIDGISGLTINSVFGSGVEITGNGGVFPDGNAGIVIQDSSGNGMFWNTVNGSGLDLRGHDISIGNAHLNGGEIDGVGSFTASYITGTSGGAWDSMGAPLTVGAITGTSAHFTGGVTVDGNVTANNILFVNDGLYVNNGGIQLFGSFQVANKAQNAYLPLATRNTTGSEVVYDISNVGNLSAGTVTATGLVVNSSADIHLNPGGSYVYIGNGAVTDQLFSIGPLFLYDYSSSNPVVIQGTSTTKTGAVLDVQCDAYFSGTITPGTINTATTPPANNTIYVRQSDNKLVYQGSSGTITVLGNP